MFLYTCMTMFTTKVFPLFLALAGFGFLIAFHEFGHWIMCKLFGVHCPTFSIGFGPTILEKKMWGTVFRLAPIPLGGYCEIAGNQEVGQGDQKFADATGDISFETKPYWQKLFIMLGGIVCNMFFAYAIFSGLYFFGIPKEEGSLTIQAIEENSAAHKAGLQKGDAVLSINKKELRKEHIMKDIKMVLLPTLAQNPDSKVILGVKRDEKMIDLPVTLASKDRNGEKIGFLGASFGLEIASVKGEYESYPFFQAVKKGIKRTHGYVWQMFGFLKSIVSSRSLSGLGGPIMILSMTFDMAQKGFGLFLILLAIISINLAVLNVLPLGALDGGQFVIVTVEAIIRRKIPEQVKIGIALSFWVFFLCLIAVLSYRDILALLR